MAGALLQLRQAGGQPGLGRRRVAPLLQQPGEHRAGTIDVAAQGRILGQASIGVQRRTGERHVAARGVGVGDVRARSGSAIFARPSP